MESITRFEAGDLSFGRSQTFPLRLGWLPKICHMLEIQLLNNSHLTNSSKHLTPSKHLTNTSKHLTNSTQHLTNPTRHFIDADECITLWGVGKNMVSAIRHWALAANIILHNNSISQLGKLLFAKNFSPLGFDHYIEHEATLWLLHWEIASKPRHFSLAFCLFNWYFKPDGFLPDEAASEITQILQAQGANVNIDAVRRDINTALKMYARRDVSNNEEVLESPFPTLDLITYVPAAKRYYCDFEARESLPAEVVGYAAARLLESSGKIEMPLREKGTNSFASLDSVFRLAEDALLQKLHDFCPNNHTSQFLQMEADYTERLRETSVTHTIH